MTTFFRLSAVVILALASASMPSAQHRLVPVAALQGEPALELMLRKLDTVGSFMMTTAHPDDENNGMLAYMSHGKGFRTTLVSATRGEGGQNEIGPELFEALAVLRTEELLAAHRFDGAEQDFTRAVDFGYSFSIEESLEKWGKPEILGDYVRMIRTIRPDVIVGFVFDGDGGGQHHQTSSRLSAEAFRAAADPAAFPEQLQKEGLRPWQAKKFYYTAGFGGGGRGGRGGGPPALAGEGAATLLQFNGGDEYDPVLGRTYTEIASEARSMHKCQGMSQLLALPQSGMQGPGGGPGGVRAYRLRDTVLPGGVNRTDRDVFDGVDTSIVALAAFAGAQPPAELTNLLERIRIVAGEARKALEMSGAAATLPLLARGLSAVRELRTLLTSMPLSADARFEIDHRLKLKEQQFGGAMVLGAGVELEAIAADGLVVAGDAVQVNLGAGFNDKRVPVSLKAVVNGFAPMPGTSGSPLTCEWKPNSGPASVLCNASPRLPADARLTAAHFKYATDAARFVVDPDVPPGLPFRPTPFTATFTLGVDGVEAPITVPIQYRSDADIFAGEKRHEIHIVPKFAVMVTPEMAIVPTDARAGRDVRATVINHSKGPAKAQVELVLPPGWRATPASAPVAFSREDEQITVRFTLHPPAGIKPGRALVKALVREGAATFDAGYQVVEYPHTTRRHVLRAPEVTLNALDVKVKPNLTIGYVMGVGDEVADALRQLGARVDLLTADDLAWGELGQYSVIMTGVRAYERRADLRAYNQRLIDYARSGGTVVVNYNKFEFNEAQYGPYPVRVGRERVTDENAVVRLLQPQHPAFTTPNRLSGADWKGWVQERGLYFLDPNGRDPQYTDLLELDEPFPYNKGAKGGALVEARVGQGRWIYIGLGLWRQLPAGTDGAFRLMANIISLGSAPKPAATQARGRQ